MANEENTPDKTDIKSDPKLEALRGLMEVNGSQDVPQEEVMFPFSGSWQPNIDGTLLGSEDYQTLINLRYNDRGLEGVNGYTERNATAISTYTNVQNGTFFKAEGRTQENYILVHAADSSNQGRVFINKTAPGSTGNFASSIGEQLAGSRANYLWSDASADLTGLFSKAPGENVVYANGEEVFIWSGDETNPASVFTTTSSAEANPVDETTKLNNKRTNTANLVEIDQTTRGFLTIMTVRPIQGIKFYVETANDTASTSTVKYWDGNSYEAVTNLSDGTADGGISLYDSGTMTFDSTRTIAKLKHFEERYLYSYQIALSAGQATLYQITVDYPPQPPSNVWDGIYRTPTQCQVYDNSANSWEDFTLHVAESSTVNTPVGAILDAFAATDDAAYFMFDEPMAGIRVTMLGQLVNSAASVMVLKYWDGDSWTALTSGTHSWVDGTSDGTRTLNKSGNITWDPPSDETIQTRFGIQGYVYQMTITGGPLTDTTAGKGTEDVVIDLLTGIPALKSVETFKFPVQYKNKLFLCNYAQGNEGNRIDYSADNAPDVFNGEDSSLNGYQSIYVSGSEHLTCGAQLYNRFGSNLFSSLVIFKANEIHLLTGDSPIDYQLFPVSFKIGCPAPKSLVTAEVGFELGDQVARNVAIFVSNSGPMMYDGAVLYPLRGIETFFDRNESTSVNFTYLHKSVAWFDSAYREYNMIIPIGDSTTPNLWLAYDMVRKKWFRKSTGSASSIQCGFNVSTSNGDQYTYGGTLTGKIAQLETGTAWGSTNIDYELQTADIFPSKNQWEITRIRRIKFVCKRSTDTDATLNYVHSVDTGTYTSLQVTPADCTVSDAYGGTVGLLFSDVDTDDADSGTVGFAWVEYGADTIDISVSGTTRIVRAIKVTNQTGWCHSFRFIFSSATATKGMEPIMWGVQFDRTRKDY